LTVTITSVDPEPKRNSVLATVVKDSHPGDHCGTAEENPGSALNLNLDTETKGVIFSVPEATLNACGTAFAEAELQNNEVVNSTTAQDGTPDPLAIMFLVTGRPDITANITLHFDPVGSQ
jgi:cation transport regulator ChaC